MTKNNYSNSIRYDTAGWNKFGREYRGTGKRGTSRKRDCHRASSRNLNVSTEQAFTISRQFVSVRNYSNAERMLAATGFTPLLVNLERMT